MANSGTRHGSGRGFVAMIIRHPWRVIAATVAGVACAGVFGGPVAGLLSPGGFTDPQSQSILATREIAALTHADPDRNLVALVRPGARIASPRGLVEITWVRHVLESDPAVGSVADASTGQTSISLDGRSTYLVAELRPTTDREAKRTAARIEARLAGDRHVTLGGFVIGNQQVRDQVTRDIIRAEWLATLLLLPLLILVFRSLVAALVPLTIGVATILITFLGLRIVNSATDLSIFAINLVTGLGLGLSIDYTLLIVSRYREEAARHGHGGHAVQRALASAGRTVLFSSLTVAVAMASLLVFPQQFLYSMGVGGPLVALTAAAIALTVLPAVLVVLGGRIDRFRLGKWPSSEGQRGKWYRLARMVMRRPGTVALASGALLIVLGAPFLGIRFTSIDASVLPATASSRQVAEALQRDFAAGSSDPITVVVDAPASRSADVALLATGIRRLSGVAAMAPPRLLGPGAWTIDVVPASGPFTEQSRHLVDAIRELPGAVPARVGGLTARFVDGQASLRSHLPVAVAIVSVGTSLILFALTGSVVLPVKALVMNGLSLSAAFGLLVLIFQQGRLSGLLDYRGQGALESTQPVLLFALAFGLSTDYGVFLLSRIKEEHDRGLPTDEAVAQGLERTGRIVSAAALLFCVAVGAFATSSIVFIKELGVGTALAVVVDATLVRALLVPSLMALLGRWNWWAPEPLRSLHHRGLPPRSPRLVGILGARPSRPAGEASVGDARAGITLSASPGVPGEAIRLPGTSGASAGGLRGR